MFALKLTSVGDSEGVILPRELRERLGVRNGDVVYFTEAPDKSYRISAHDPDFARQMKSAEKMMRRYKDALAALAK